MLSWGNTGLIDDIPFGGVRVYTIVNAKIS